MIYLHTAKRGGGKTAFCLNQLKAALDAHQKAAFIIPEQLSLYMEGKVVSALGAVGGNIEVFSFNRLFRKIYRLSHKSKRVYMDKTGKNMLVNRILETGGEDFSVFRTNTNLSEGLVSALSEFKRHFASSKQLREAANAFSSPISQKKFTELADILERFDASLSNSNADSNDDLSLLPDLIDACAYIKDFTFYVDGFDGFTPQELKVLLSLARDCDVHITLCLEQNRTYVFRPTLETAEKLQKACSDAGIAFLQETLPDFEEKLPCDLYYLKTSYGKFGAEAFSDTPENITAFSAETPYAEADVVARRILSLAKEGYRFGDMYVLVPDLESMRPIYEKSFALHRIPMFADSNKTILGHGLTKLLLSLCDIFIHSFSVSAVFSFLKNSFIPIPSEQVDELEYYVLETGISGNEWQEEWTATPDKKYNLVQLNNTRKAFLDLVTPFREATKGKTDCAVFSDALIAFLKQIKADETVNRMASECDPVFAQQEMGVFNQVLSVLHQLKITLGGTEMGIEKLRANLKAGFNGCSIGIIPPTVDHVTVTTAERNNYSGAKILFITGATEGAFPQSVTGSGMITDSEREVLEQMGITLSASNRKKALCSPFAVYMALTAPSDKLILSYPVALKSGESTTKSSVFHDLNKLFPNLSVKSEFMPESKELITTPEATLPHLLLTQKEDDVLRAVYGWYLQDNQWKHKINRYFAAKNYATTWRLSEQCALSLWGKTLKVSISKLEKFASCPLSFFLTYGLRLQERKVHAFTPPEAGTLMHAVMEEFVQSAIETGLDFKTLTFEETKKRTLEISEKVLGGQLALFPTVKKRYAFLLSRIEQNTVNAVWAVVHHIKSGVFTPYATEFEFDGDAAPVLDTPNGNRLILTGKIDRIDKSETGYRIIDYKSGEKDLELSAVVSGRSLQLPIYSYALKNDLGKPKGMFYLTVDAPLVERDAAYQDNTPDEKLLKEFRLEGYMVGDEQDVLEMDTEMESYSNVIPARRNKDGNVSTGRLLSPEEYQIIEDAAVRNVKKFGDLIIGGSYEVLPYAEERFSACTYCAFRSVCRFDAYYCKVNNEQKQDDNEILGRGDAQNGESELDR
ncbi:MAG: PD-(D/E)XK nuclease family protein [Clostridia bacterium]|nr:PD-(D/E)XK nuclease family protein [Clostridia bacterium]